MSSTHSNLVYFFKSNCNYVILNLHRSLSHSPVLHGVVAKIASYLSSAVENNWCPLAWQLIIDCHLSLHRVSVVNGHLQVVMIKYGMPIDVFAQKTVPTWSWQLAD